MSYIKDILPDKFPMGVYARISFVSYPVMEMKDLCRFWIEKTVYFCFFPHIEGAFRLVFAVRSRKGIRILRGVKRAGGRGHIPQDVIQRLTRGLRKFRLF